MGTPISVFKVIAETKDGCLVSAQACMPIDGSKPAPIVEYKLGEWVNTHEEFRKRGYHLLAFTKYEYAQAWIYYVGGETKWNNGKLQIYQAVAKGKRKLVEQHPLISLDLFGAETLKDEQEFANRWPLGAAMYKEIMLVSKM